MITKTVNTVGMTTQEVFAKYGEDIFRLHESGVDIETIAQTYDMIHSTVWFFLKRSQRSKERYKKV